MRLPSILFAAGALSLVVGCSAASQSPGTPSLGSTLSPERSATLHGMPPSAARGFAGALRVNSLRPVRPDSGPRGLYVAEPLDSGNGHIDVYANKTWAPIRTLTKGLNGPHGEWLNGNGKLYVTNIFGATVVTFAPGGSTPTFTYSDGLFDPVTVVTDAHGHLYVADYNREAPGFIDKYAPGVNKLKQQCSLTGSPEGVAIDASGDLYASYLNPDRTGSIEKFPNGSCSGATKLGVTTGWPGALAVDSQGNLLLADQTLPGVDIIAPPYTNITKQITKGFVSGDSDPIALSLNRKTNLLFVTDARNSGVGDVVVFKYPSGKILTTLGASDGISQPLGVADYPGFVP